MGEGIKTNREFQKRTQSFAGHNASLWLAFCSPRLSVIYTGIGFQVNIKQIFFKIFSNFLFCCCRTLQPLFLLGLIAYYTSGEENIQRAYVYAAGVILCSALNVIIMHPYMLGTMHIGMKIRVAMCSMIYRKALRLSKTALGNTTAGQIVNLISNDVGRLDLAMLFIHYLWVGPLETLLITYLMYREVRRFIITD